MQPIIGLGPVGIRCMWAPTKPLMRVTGGCTIPKEHHCRDRGFDGDAVITTDSADEIVAQVAAERSQR